MCTADRDHRDNLAEIDAELNPGPDEDQALEDHRAWRADYQAALDADQGELDRLRKEQDER